MRELYIKDFLTYLGVHGNYYYSTVQNDIRKGKIPGRHIKKGKMNRLVVNIDDPIIKEYGQKLVVKNDKKFPDSDHNHLWYVHQKERILKKLESKDSKISEISATVLMYE
jgi:hypothetical protein